MSLGCYKSSFGNIKFHICKKAALATRVAFLASMTSKLKKSDEGRKGHIKGQRVNESKNLQFFCIFGFFSSRLLPVFHIFQFRGH